MADYIFLKKNGKGADIKVSRQDFAKNPNAYRDYTVRMVDKDGSNWDVPFNHINDAVKDGAHVFNMRENTHQQKTTTPATQPKSAVAQQAVNFAQKPAQPYQPTWQEQAGMSMAVDQAANMGGSDVQPMVKPGLDTNMLNQNNALANRAMATNLESNQDNLYLDELEKKANELAKQGMAEVNAKESEKPFSQRVFENMNSTTKAGYTSTPYTREVENNEKIRQANLIQTNVRDARKAIKDAEISQDGSWYQKLGRGLANGVDVRNFDFGITKLRNSMTLLSAANNPNDINNAILDSEALKNKIIKENEDKISDWIKAGETTTIMVPFMIQIGSTPFKGLGTAASKWVMGKVGQEIAGSLGKRAALLALKGTTRFLGDTVEGAGTAAFFNTAGITADALRRQRGNAVGQYGSDGYFHYNEMEGGEDSYAKAFAKAFGASAIEYQSELVGEYFSPLLKGIGKVAGKGLQKAGVLGIKEGFDTTGKKFTNIMLNFGGKNVSLDKTIGMITALSNKQYLKAFNDFTKATRWNGVIGEYAEEVVGNIENAALIGDMNWGTGKNGVFNPEQNWETFLSVAVGSGFMGAIGGGFYMGSRLAVNRGLKKSDKKGMELFGADAWRSIKDGFETADNPARFLAAISQNLDEPSKRAIQNYAAYSMAKKGELVADMKQRMEEPQPTNVRITPYKGRFVVQSIDPNGNIIESKDYDSEEDANIYKERVATYIDNARKVQAYNDFILRDDIFDYDYDTYALLQKIAYKDPLKRTDAEQEFFDNFINSTENITYPTNEVHEEHDAQKGTDLAEETSENIVEGAKPLNDREAAAKTRWNAVIQSQPDIDSLVGTMVNQGMTSNEIAQRLVDDYGGESEVVEAFCELCNAKANKDGYINRIGQLIQSKVENDIDEASFAGTVNGNEDKSNIYLLTNGTNTFALIGGDITVDSNNNISSNGIAIMLDGQGNRITRPDLTGFSLRGIVDKNQYKQSSLLELQQEATAAIQATETVVPEVQQPQATEPQNEVPQQEQPQEQPQAQAEEQPQEPAATTEKESPIPLGENGEMLYHKAPIEATINYLYDGALEDEEIRDFVQNNIDESTKGYEKTTKKKPKIGTDKNAYLQAKQAWQQQVDEAKQKLDYWNSVNDYIQQQTHTTPEEIQKAQDELSGKTAQQEYANSKPDMSVTPVQFAGEFIRESKIQTQSFYNETGFGDAERKKFPKMIANDGKTIDSLAEELVSADDTYHNGSLYHGDTTEAKNAILEALQSASKKSELGKNTSDDFKEYERQREEAREAFYEENFNMSYSDYLAFEEQQMPNIWRRMSNFVAEEYDRIVNESYELRDEQNNVEQINNENNGNNTEGNRQLAGGSEVLPTEGSNQQGGTSTSTNPAAETTNGSEGGNQNEEVSGGSQGVGQLKIISEEDFDINSIDFENNYVVAHQTLSDNAESIINSGLRTAGGLMGTSTFVSREEIERLLKTMREGHGHRGSDSLVIMQFPKSWFNGKENVKLDDISTELSDRFGFDAFMTVPSDFISNIVEVKVEKAEEGTQGELKKNSASDNTTDTDETVNNGKLNDTATQQNTVSDNKDTTKSPNSQENQQKTDEKVEESQKEEESQPLTEADIDTDEIADEYSKELAKEFLRGENTGTIAELFYREIAGRVQKKGEKKEEKKPSEPKPLNTPPTGQAESDKLKSEPKEKKPKADTPKASEQKNSLQQALDEFKDVMRQFRDAGRMDASVSLVGLNSRQIEMLGKVFRATAKLGYEIIKKGATSFENWLETMKVQVADIIKVNSNWNDQDITDLLTEAWNNKYPVDGVYKPLSQWAAEEALAAEQKQEEENAQPATVPDSSVVGGKRFPFTKQELEGMTKQQMIDAMWHEVFPKVCEMYKVPSDIMDENAYWFSPRMTTGYPKDSLVAACMKYMEHLNDEVQPASEKQMNYIMKLAAEDEKKLFKDITLTKVAASRVISLMQREEDMINDHSSKQEDFAEVYNELEKIARLNGADLSQKDTKKAERKFVDNVATTLTSALETGEKPYASIVTLRKAAREAGMEVGENGETDIKIQELVEDALVRVAKNIMTTAHIAQVANKANNKFAKEIFDKIKLLYNLQPTISMRSSNRIALQQYSTPLPMAFVADMFATGAKAPLFFNVFEPTAGNGMLVFAIPSSQVHVNEIDENRLDNLRGQEFRQVTSQDATQPFTGDRKYNAIITNPPFGSTEAKDYDGYSISGLAPQIALNALDRMKDNGKAVIIIGGNQKFAPNGRIQNDLPFLAYLYNHYNVKGVIDMEGSLYAKQGTTFPTRMILIDGRRTEEERKKSDVYPPTIKNWINKASDFDRLYDTVNELLNSKEKTNGTEIVRTEEQSATNIGNDTSRNTDVGGRKEQSTEGNQPIERVRGGLVSGNENVLVQPSGNDRNDGREQTGGQGVYQPSDRGNDGRMDGGKNGGGRTPDEHGTSGKGADTVGQERNAADGRQRSLDSTVHSNGSTTSGDGTILKDEKRSLESEKLPYRPHNGAFSLESVAPAAMVEAMDKTLKRIEEEYGNIDEFVTNELGYSSLDDMHKALAAEQVDSVAMAIYNMKKGEAIVIGDQTGVGKGRQMAALIRWARRQGKKPIFMTQKSNLFNDIYRDLKDIGSENLKPFIFNGDKDAKIVEIYEDENGNEKQNVIYRSSSKEEINEALESGKIPDDCDFVLCTYSQISTGDETSREYEKELSKQGASKRRSRKKNTDTTSKKDTKAVLLRKLAKGNYLMLDESHTAAGESNQGFYMQTLVRDSKAVTFASATYAKRPDTMPLYALRTAMSKANIGMQKLIEAIQKGGVTLQEIMSRALTNSGQMVRRERDMKGVVTDWKTIDDPETVKRARENYDRTIQAFNAIIDFQKKYIQPFIDSRREDLAVVAGNAGFVRGTEEMGISNTPFASQTYNYTKQLMLALKVDAIVDEVDKQIKAGRKPLIALDNTMGSYFDQFSPGEEVTDSTFAENLLRGLNSVMQYSQDMGNGVRVFAEITPNELGSEGEAAYYELVSFIKESTKNIFASPLDEITAKLRAKGYTVGELTGRENIVVKEDGTYRIAKREKISKQLLQSRFNSGKIDVVILNKTGSTGISLHASKTFADQRQRVMVLAQPLPDINDYMQMVGRIDRTGQVKRGYYINLGLPVPAEQRFLMMLSTKLKSLNANTTTSQESKDNKVEAPDMLNKYGSQVIVEYFKDNPDIYNKLGDPLKLVKKQVSLSEYAPSPDDEAARKLTGYVALLSTDEQQAFYDDVIERYNNLIKYLDDSGTNDLKITSLPLNATTLARAVSSEGNDPTGDNPFAQNAYVEKVEMDVLRKPMKATEINNVVNTIAKGKDPKQAVEDIKAQYETEFKAKLDKQKRKYEAELERNKETLKKYEDKINSSEKMSEEDKQKAIEDKKESLQQDSDRKNDNAISSLEYEHERMIKALDLFKVGGSYLIPDNLDTLAFDLTSHGIFLGYKAKDNGITPSSTIAVFATLDGRRRVEIKLSEGNKIANVNTTTNQNYDAAQQVNLTNWDNNIPNITRKTGYIITGNILQAINDSQDENGNFTGQLVSYTDSEGNIHDGVLMPDKWEPTMMVNAGNPISSAKADIESGKTVISINGEVEIVPVISRYYPTAIYLRVPRSKKLGAKYYENEDLIRAIDEKEFYQNSGKLQTAIPNGKLDEVLSVLSKMGVKVPSDIVKQLTPQQDNRLAYSSSTNNVNNPRIIPEDVDKDVSLQIESEFDEVMGKITESFSESSKKMFYDMLDGDIEYFSYATPLQLEDEYQTINLDLYGKPKEGDNRNIPQRYVQPLQVYPTEVGNDIRNAEGRNVSPGTDNEQSSTMVFTGTGETVQEIYDNARGEGGTAQARQDRDTNDNLSLLHQVRLEIEGFLEENSTHKLSSYQARLLAEKLAISREVAYRRTRQQRLADTLGIKAGRAAALDEVAEAFEKTNKDREIAKLFEKILAVNKRLGTSIEILPYNRNGRIGESGIRRNVYYFLDGLTQTFSNEINIPVVIAHELLHQGTLGAINLVMKGKAEGVLTKEQIDAVNTIIDIYNKAVRNKEAFAENPYGLQSPYEFAAQMVDPRQRRALSMSPLQRVMAAANELKAQGNNSLWERIKNALKTLFGLSDLKKMDKAINTLLDTFSETVHDISMNDVDQNGWGYFIGEKGARNMDKAEEATVRLDNLKAARQFETMGKDPKTIKWATGWERGADGKWRYEIPDITIKPDNKIDDKKAETRVIGRGFSQPIAKLSDIVESKELFDAYPQLKDIDIAIYEPKDDSIAYYIPALNTIALSSSKRLLEDVYAPVENWDEINKYINEEQKLINALSEEEEDYYYDAKDYFGGLSEYELSKDENWQKLKKDMPRVADLVILFNNRPEKIGGEVIGTRIKESEFVRGVLSHEIQHVIQSIENFAAGGSSDEYEDNEEYKNLTRQYKKLRKGERKAYEEWRKAQKEYDEAYSEWLNLRIQPDWDFMNISDEEIELEKKINKLKEKKEEALAKHDTEKEKIKPIEKRLENFELRYYENLGGEVESRNVQSRINMTLEQRSRSLASETEDVAREDQIFIYDNFGKNEMRSGDLFDSMQKPQTSEETKSRMRDAAASLAKSLNTPIKIVTSDKAPEGAKNAKGTYDTQTGEVVIVLDNNQSVLDIEKTVVHEIIGHHGLRGLLGSVRNYRQLMNVIYDSLPEKQKNEIKDKAMRNGYKFYEAMDEYFAEQAENMVWDSSSATMWDNIKHYITEAIRKLGFILRPNYRDVRYWLWLSKNNLQSDNPLSEIKRQAFLHKLSRLDAPKFDDNFNETEGDISYTDVDTAFRNGNIQGGTAWQIIEQRLKDNKQYWKESFVDYMNSYRIFQEEMAKGIEGGLMDNMNAYLGENQISSKVAELQDQFLNNEVKNLQKQIDELKTEFGKGEEGVRTLEQYLIMKHGLERNRVLFVRDWFNNNIRKNVTESDLPEEAKLILENKQIDIETRFEDGDITEEQRDKLLKQAPQEAWEEYVNDKFNKFTTFHSQLADNVDRGLISLQDMYTRLDANINSFADFDPNNNDKSGLSAMTEYFVDDNYSDDAIVQQVMSIDEMLGDRKTNLWNAVEAVTQKGLDYDFMSGIVGEEAYNRAKTMFRWYIPLRGMDQKTMEDQYTYIQNSSGIGKKSLVTAKGRTTLAKSPLSTATQMGLSAISRGERNINKQRAYRLVNRWLKENENEMPPATIVDVWYEITGADINGNPKMEIAIPPITDDMNDEQIRTTVAIFNQRMKDLKRQGLAMNNKIPVEHMRPFDSKNHKSEHIVFVNINGKQKMIVFNGNPRPAQALNGDLNPSNSDNLFKKLMRIMAAAFTSYNPTFLATNLSRDILFSNSNVSIKEGKNYWLKFTKNQSVLLGNFATKYRKLWKDYNNGVQPTTDMGRYFEEFMKNGGKTGFVNQKKIDELQRMLYNNDKKEFAAKSLSMVFDFIENMNDRVENMNRFAAYVTSREMGRSVMRSINDAKEVSVNFNRKGAGSSTAKGENVTPAAKLAGSVGGAFRSSYLFFNAGIQSFYTLARNIENHPFKTSAYAMAVPFIAGSFLVPMLNKIIGLIFGDDGDDEYANIPEWTRRNNICIYLTNGNWAKIPLPIELRAFYGLGDIAAGYTIDERLQSTQNLGIDITSQLSQILPVDFMGEGGNVLAAFVPDVIKPVVQIMTNTDWTGKPIQKATTPFNKYDPEYTKAFKYEFEPFVKLSKNINNLTGGTDVTKGWYDGWWNSPAYWNHLIGGYGGGFVQDIMRTAKTSERLLTRDFDEWSIKEIPILKALFETPTERTQYYRTMNKFQMYRDEAAKSKHDLNKWRKSEDPLLKARFIHDTNKATKPNYVKRMELVDKYLRFENRANKIIDSPRVEEIVKKAKKEELTKAKIELVKKLDELE